MNILKNWMDEINRRPVKILNEIYTHDQVARDELNSLYLNREQGVLVPSNRVPNELLNQLHGKIRDHSCEEAIWDAVVWHLSNHLPKRIAHDLIDRGVSVIAMSFTRQVDEVQWRMATLVEDALYTLIRERYVDPCFSTSQFKIMLEMYNIRYDGITYMLSFYETTSAEKKGVLLALIEYNKKREEDKIDIV